MRNIAQTLWVLVLLHGPGGNEILLESRSVASLHSSVPGKENEVITNEARCLINTNDGKFVSVIEECSTVRRIIEQTPTGRKK